MTEPALAESVQGYGRMYRHPVNRELYPSVTNIIDTLAKPWLAGWKAKVVAGHAWDNRMALVRIQDRDAAVDMLKGGPKRIRDTAAEAGDKIHQYAEAVARGLEPPEIPEELETHVEPFLTFLDEYKPRFRVLEGNIYKGEGDDPDRYAGSFDFLAEIEGFVLLGDWKSGGDRVYAEVALQLAGLRHGDELWDEKTGDLMPMPKVDACVAVHLRPNKPPGVHIIDASDEAYRAFLGLRAAWPWDKKHDGAVGPRMNLERLVKELRRPDTLLAQLEMSVEESSSGVGKASVPSQDPHERMSVAPTAAPVEDSPADAGANEAEGAGVTALVAAPAPAGEDEFDPEEEPFAVQAAQADTAGESDG